MTFHPFLSIFDNISCHYICTREKNIPVLFLLVRFVFSKPESLAVSGLVNKEGSWPRKDEELSRRNR
jgi:hypothetical protein